MKPTRVKPIRYVKANDAGLIRESRATMDPPGRSTCSSASRRRSKR
jgi:hypothetical protein